MAKLPPRDSKGRFKKRGSRSRRRRSRRNPSKAKLRRKARNQPRDAMGRFVGRGRKSRSRSRSYRRNPGGLAGDIGGQIMDGGIAAVQLTAGKAASRAIPPMMNLPSSGPVGVAIRAATGVLVGLLADRVMPGQLPERLLEGALQGAVEDLVVGYDVPFIGPALARPAGMGGAGSTGLYTGGRPLRAGGSHRLGAYTGSSPTVRNGAGLTAAHRN